MRKTYIIIAAVILIFAVGEGLYLYFATKTPSISVAPQNGGSLPIAGQNTNTPDTTTGVTNSGGSDATSNTIESPVSVTSKLVQISAGPVVPGEVVLDVKGANSTSTPSALVKFIERTSGNVFSYASKTRTLTRINNKTLPGIQSATWLPDGSRAFVQYLSGIDFSIINTYSLAASSTEGFFLPQDLAGIEVSKDKLLLLASGSNGSIASLTNLDGSKSTQLFTTPLSSLRVSFAGKNQYLAFPKPSGALPGDAFLVNASGRFSRFAGPLNGLVALASPSGKWAIVSYTESGSLRMQLVNTTTSEAISLPVATIADKCVWAADETTVWCGVPTSLTGSYLYPDDWYQGAAHFSDRIWKINVTGRYTQLVLDFSTANKGALDATALAVNPSKTTLVFVNKNDGSLWSYSL